MNQLAVNYYRQRIEETFGKNKALCVFFGLRYKQTLKGMKGIG